MADDSQAFDPPLWSGQRGRHQPRHTEPDNGSVCWCWQRATDMRANHV